MKIIINNDYGALSGLLEDNRLNPKYIELVESNQYKSECVYETPIVVEIPHDATDYIVADYDGLESVIYVRNGKIEILNKINCRYSFRPE